MQGKPHHHQCSSQSTPDKGQREEFNISQTNQQCIGRPDQNAGQGQQKALSIFGTQISFSLKYRAYRVIRHKLRCEFEVGGVQLPIHVRKNISVPVKSIGGIIRRRFKRIASMCPDYLARPVINLRM